MISKVDMSTTYQTQRRQRQKEWYEVIWDALKGVVVQILYAIIDGVVVKVKEEIRKAFGYEQSDWRTQYV